ncbi:MAG: MarR family transcriptional regulator [Frondihabitans sp.]|nr:MarR family transcriptional regulator [Frondihabitans sp.]
MATRFVVGVGAISKVVDRLESRGWAKRTPNPADGRSSLISLNARGLALVTEAERTFHDQLEELIASAIGVDQVETTAVALAALRRSLERAGAGTPIG